MRAFSPAFQPDEIALRRIVNRLTRKGTIPIEDVIARLENRNLPTPIAQVPFMVTIPAGAGGTQNAKLLIPRNPRRLSFFIVVLTVAGGHRYTFGPPVQGGSTPPAVTYSIPISKASGTESNGTVSTDDIWVHRQNAPGLAAIYLGYEGVLSS